MIALGQLIDNIKATLTVNTLQWQLVGLLITHFCDVIFQRLNFGCTYFLLSIKVDSSLFRQEQIFLSSFACIRETNFRRSLFHVHIQDTLNIIPILLSCRKIGKVLVFPKEERTPVVHHRLEFHVCRILSITLVIELFTLRIGLKRQSAFTCIFPNSISIVGIFCHPHLKLYILFQKYINLTADALQLLVFLSSDTLEP